MRLVLVMLVLISSPAWCQLELPEIGDLSTTEVWKGRPNASGGMTYRQQRNWNWQDRVQNFERNGGILFEERRVIRTRPNASGGYDIKIDTQLRNIDGTTWGTLR